MTDETYPVLRNSGIEVIIIAAEFWSLRRHRHLYTARTGSILSPSVIQENPVSYFKSCVAFNYSRDWINDLGSPQSRDPDPKFSRNPVIPMAMFDIPFRSRILSPSSFKTPNPELQLLHYCPNIIRNFYFRFINCKVIIFFSVFTASLSKNLSPPHFLPNL